MSFQLNFGEGKSYEDTSLKIRLGLEERLDVSIYTNPYFISGKMEEIRIGLEKKLD